MQKKVYQLTLIQIITMIHIQSQPYDHHFPDPRFAQKFKQPMPQASFNASGQMRKKIQNYSFLLSDRIGKGYSSTVYKGLDDLTGQQVAIKVIELKSLRDQTSRLMLNTEIQCFKQVKHPNILHYYDSFFTANNCYIITEYCPGGDLAKVMKQRGSIPQQEARLLFCQIFQAYKAFYEAGYVHRDLKPANIFIAQDGGLRLADFGFSKKRTLIDRQNYNVGTPIYMPRQSLAANIYNEKTDLWALGITLYEMIFGYVPFRGYTEQELRNNIERNLIVFSQNVSASEQLKDFISKTLLKDSLARMGVREMQRHPWLASLLVGTGKSSSQSPQKIQEENDLRSSLPQDAVLHNRSRQYFENKQNRRSTCSMQKLKLCMPKKGSQIIQRHRQPLGERSLNNTGKHYLSIENKENKPNRENRTSSSTNKSVRETIKEPIKRKENTTNGVEKVVSLINYFRMLYRLLEKVATASTELLQGAIKSQLQKAHRALSDRVVEIFKKHLVSISDRSNQFNLRSELWMTFITSERWQMYEFVIGKYQHKYTSLLQKAAFSQGQWQSADKLFLDFWEAIEQEQPSRLLLREKYLCTEVLGLLSHLCDLDRVINEQGWSSFTEQYAKNQSILMESYLVNMDNFDTVKLKLRSDYSDIKKRQGTLRFQ